MTHNTQAKAFRDATSVVGIGYSRSKECPGGFSRNSGESVMTLILRSALEACRDAGIDPAELDGAATYALSDSAAPDAVLAGLGANEINYISNLFGGGNYPVVTLMQAAHAVYTGVSKFCLVYRGMNGRSGSRIGHRPAGSEPVKAMGPEQFSTIYGFSGPPSRYALTARRYMDLFGVSSEDFGRWAVNSRSNASKNPRATMRTPITVEDHQASRIIVDPYHLLDCCLETDVSCAMVVTTTERARDLKKPPVSISAAVGGPTFPPDEIVDTGLRRLGPRVLAEADVDRSDLSLFMPYDNFTDYPMRMVEDMGWCQRGEIGGFIAEGNVTLDGKIPVLTQGGLMSEGYAHGLNNLLEAVQQLRHEAEDLCPGWLKAAHTYDRDVCRQVRNADVALCTGVEGLSAMILRRA
jgi:acetyl-CoA acetyltransferase